jgi:hypothetical protein
MYMPHLDPLNPKLVTIRNLPDRPKIRTSTSADPSTLSITYLRIEFGVLLPTPQYTHPLYRA